MSSILAALPTWRRPAALVALVALATASCSKPPASGELPQAKRDRDAARKEASTLASENAKLKADLARVSQQLRELSATDEGLWSTAYQQRQQGGREGVAAAQKTLTELLARFPASPHARDAQRTLAALLRDGCSQRLAAIPPDGASAEREAVEASRDALATLGRDCATAGRDLQKRIASRQAQAQATLSRWPAAMTVQDFKAHYRELLGKRAALSGSLTASSYYNFGYGDPRKLRALTLQSEEFGGLYLYCARAEAWCGKLFDSLKGGNSIQAKVIVENSRQHYQANTTDMALLVSAQPTGT